MYSNRQNAAGEVQTVTTYAMVAGAKRPVKVGQRSYCGDFVFEGDSLTEVNFAGGYFDGEGRPHFRHADWQGNVAIVTDRDGQIEQHNGYYPYGEPWREPTGQNRLFGGKERMRDGGLNDYDYVARRLNSATGIWGQPDPMAGDFAGTNPYVFCAANPIKFIDPTGCFITNTDGSVYIEETDKTHIFREANVEAVVSYAFTSNNKSIEVLINKSTNKGYDTNCHGYSFLKGAAWINKSKDVYTIADNDYRTLNEGEAVQKDDVILYETVEPQKEKNSKKEHSKKNSEKKEKVKKIAIHSAIVDDVSDDCIIERYVMADESEVKTISHDQMKRSYQQTYKDLNVTFLRKTVDDIQKK